MGQVYEVEHIGLGVHYALKTFVFSNADDEDAESGNRTTELLRTKFLEEGQMLARLKHPHLIRVFDLAIDDETRAPYYVMDLVLYKDGDPHTLADVETSDLEEEYIHQWFIELAAALDYIHAQGIVHRDIKLNNVLLSADKHVILSDFGVSRFFSDNLRREVKAINTMISAATNSRLVMGTQGYMAPEVERGEEATPAADTYSLGIMIVYLLTGVWYENGSKVLQLLDTFELSWNQVVPQMLAENPKERPTNLSALASKLGTTISAKEAATSSTTDSRNSVGSRVSRDRKWIIISAIIAIILTAVVGAMFVVSSRITRDSGQAGHLSLPISNQDDSSFSAEGIFEVSQ